MDYYPFVVSLSNHAKYFFNNLLMDGVNKEPMDFNRAGMTTEEDDDTSQARVP